jgi:hypothetical protein
MSWDTRDQADSRAEAIVSLTDGIANNVDPSDLQAYASTWGIPLAMQSKVQKTASAPAPQPAPPAPVDEDEDDYYDSYDDDYYESSDCW